MQSIPNIARERLKAGTSEADHPDANLLSAFAEKSLPERERGTLLDHLARCSECRDVLALALPATEEIQPAAKPSPTRWLTWPALRWGLVTAGVAIIATFGIVENQRHTATAARFSPASPKSEPVSAKLAPTPLNADVSAEKTVPKTASPELPARGYNLQPSPNQKEEHQVSAAALASAPRSNAMIARRAIAPSTPPSMRPNSQTKVPAASESVQVENEVVEAPPQAQQVQSEQAQADQSLPATHAEDSDARIGKAKAPVTTTVEVSGAAPLVPTEEKKDLPLTGRNFTQLTSITPANSPRWNISSTGTLQRSFDQGATWQDVDVAASSSTGAPVGGPVKAPAARTAASGMNLDKQAALPTFRAVAANGSDVWAGGSAGLLYHSVDGGNHWTRVLPSGAGSVLTGDIVSIEFSDAQHGKITTSTPEVWTTPDNGGTWQKQ